MYRWLYWVCANIMYMYKLTSTIKSIKHFKNNTFGKGTKFYDMFLTNNGLAPQLCGNHIYIMF